jgi:hypothetical protein
MFHRPIVLPAIASDWLFLGGLLASSGVPDLIVWTKRKGTGERKLEGAMRRRQAKGRGLTGAFPSPSQQCGPGSRDQIRDDARSWRCSETWTISFRRILPLHGPGRRPLAYFTRGVWPWRESERVLITFR